jgi:hypothetical protein
MRGSDTLGSLDDRLRLAMIAEFRSFRRRLREAGMASGDPRPGRRNIGKPDYITGK